MLQGISQSGAQILDPGITLNPLNNFYFTASSSLLIILAGWYVTDRIVEPRLRDTPLDGDLEDLPAMEPLNEAERSGLRAALGSVILALSVLVVTALPETSPWRGENGSLTELGAPLMGSIVSLIFVLFLIPGIVYGRVAGTMKGMKDIIDGMSKSMSDMAYYLVIMFFIAQFVYAFGQSNLGVLLALEGANFLKAMNANAYVTIVGIVVSRAEGEVKGEEKKVRERERCQGSPRLWFKGKRETVEI